MSYDSPLNRAFCDLVGMPGRMTSGSKTAPKNHIVFFNACVFDDKYEQVWHGDIDLSDNAEALTEIRKVGSFYITREHPFRFDGLGKKVAKEARKGEIETILYFPAA